MKTVKTLHFIFEIIVAVGYAIGLFPFGYLFSFLMVIPLTIANLVFATIQKSETKTWDLINIILAIVSLIPILGFPTRIAGLVIAILAAVKLSKHIL